MRFHCFRWWSLLLGCALWAASAAAQVPQSGYLCCNMRSDGYWISDLNFAGDGIRLIPVGTPVKVTDHRRYRLSVELRGTAQVIGNDYSRDLDMPTFAGRYVVAEDPRTKIASFEPATRLAIAQQRVSKGMTREQVLMSVGYPVTSETPHLEAPLWKFWVGQSAGFDVLFGEDDRVREIVTDPLTRKVVVAE